MALTGTAQAALHDRGGGLIYDDALNITWLQDWNYAKTSGYDEDGLMNWTDAKTWAENLVYGGYSDWRLPTVSPVNGSSFQYSVSNNGSTDRGYAKTGPGGGWGLASEMGHMYYVTLANKGICRPDDASPTSCTPQSGFGLANTGQFTNMQPRDYWFGTAYAPDPAIAWYVSNDEGYQNIAYKSSNAMYAVAVRPGDVAAVPEPSHVALLFTGLGVLGLTTRRRAGRAR